MKIKFAITILTLIPLFGISQIQAGFSFDDSICIGDCITFTDTSAGDITTYSWIFNNGTPSTSNAQNPGVICFNSSGSASVDLTVTGPSGTSTVSQIIFVGEFPDSMHVSKDTLIEMGGAAYVAAVGFPNSGTFTWTPSGIYDCESCAETVASPLVPTDAIVIFTNGDGCSIQDTIKIGVKFIDVIDVPNSFSPDDSGFNDKVFVKGPGIVNMTFRVFDRYGRKMFETTDQKEGWDGTFNGKKLPPATFMWTCEYSLIGGLTNVKSGTITLIK